MILNQRHFLFLGLIYLTYIIIMPQYGHLYDMSCWNMWSRYIFEHGLPNAYDSGTNYMPGFMYVFYVFGLLQGSLSDISTNTYALKAIILLFDIIGVVAVILFIRDQSKTMLILFATLLNVAFMYNTVVWGQVDAIHSFFGFVAVIFALRKKYALSILSLVLALNFKLQAIIFIPPLVLLLLPPLVKNFKFQKFLKGILIVALVQLLILLPFIIAGKIQKVGNVVFSSVGYFPVVSMNAFNFWHLVLDGDLMKTTDSITFAGITYKNWGLFLFCVSSFFAMLPLCIDVFNQIIKKRTRQLTPGKTFITFSLIPILFFFFNTEMHERYTHPMFLFLVALVFMRGKHYYLLILASIAYFLNMEYAMKFLNLNNYKTLIFAPEFVATLYLILILGLFYHLYQRDSQMKQEQLATQ